MVQKGIKGLVRNSILSKSCSAIYARGNESSDVVKGAL